MLTAFEVTVLAQPALGCPAPGGGPGVTARSGQTTAAGGCGRQARYRSRERLRLASRAFVFACEGQRQAWTGESKAPSSVKALSSVKAQGLVVAWNRDQSRPRLGVNHREVSGRLADVQRLSAPQDEG